MNLSAPFILRPVMTTLVMIALFVMGVAAYNYLPVSNLPDVDYPVITVTTSFPGASPEIMANTVATPLEKQFMAIPGLRYLTSSNSLGLSTIVLEFDINKNIDLVAVDVQTAISTAKPNLPPNLPQDPTYKKVNPASTPVMYIAVTSPTMTQGELYDYANTFIGQHISTIEGVSQVSVYGSASAVRVQVDPGLIASFGLTLDDVSQSIANANQYLPLGQFDGNKIASLIYDNGALYKAANYRPLIVTYVNGAPVRLSDLGKVVDSVQNDRVVPRYIEGKIDQPDITLAILQQPGSNAVRMADQIRNLLPTLEKQLPGAVEVLVVYDRSQSVRESISEVQKTLIIAFILVLLVIFFYLGKIKETIIPSIAMPMAVFVTFAAIYPLGYTLDNLSLLALTLAIGFIIDDAIVVLENIVRKVEGGETPLQASLNGSKQICFTIVSMTLSLAAVFIPLIFMAGVIGKIFQEFAITLLIVTVASGFISLTLTPMLCSRFIPQKGKEGKLQKFSNHVNDWMVKHYKNMLVRVLRYKKTVLMVGLLSILLSLYFFMTLPQDFLPDDDIGFILAYTEAAQGTSSDQMRLYQQEVVDALKEDSAIASIISISSTPEYRQGIIFLGLIPHDKRKAISVLIQEYNAKVRQIPGINVFFKNVPLINLNIGTTVRGAYQYLMQSLDSESLYQSADELYQKMRNDPTFQGVSTDLEIKTPQLSLEIQRDLASSLGIDVHNFENSLLLSYSGNRISRIQTPIDQYDVILEQLRDFQREPVSLDSIYLRATLTDALVPLSAIANWKQGVGPASVNHFDQFPAVTITFNIAPGIALSDALLKVRELAADSFAPGVTGDVKGAAQSFEEAMSSMAFLLIVTIFVIYIVLGILYEDFIHPITILSTLPPAIVGGLLTLYITGKPLSLYAFLGIILLIGIVKKNGILIVDFALDNVRIKGESAEDSILNACLVRFRPIMMTTVAAIMGAMPIAFGTGAGSESRKPLGYVIIGGLIVSQMITLFLTPVIYLYFERLREKLVSHKSAA